MKLVPAQHLLEGAGFEVKRPFPGPALDAVGPFILLDQIGPTIVEPGKAVGAPTHPHVGIETLTYFLEGEGMHLDSLGNRAVTGPGQAQWMRAGRGIIHDEGPTERMMEAGGPSHAIQFWINMPGTSRQAAPDYRTFKSEDFSQQTSAAGSIKVIAGTINGATGPLDTFAEPYLAHAQVTADAILEITIDPSIEIALYPLNGDITLEDKLIHAHVLARLPEQTERFTIGAKEAVDVLILGGPPLEESLFRYGPFVTGNEAEMREAITNYRDGKFGTIEK